jgi:hypothetical protein
LPSKKPEQALAPEIKFNVPVQEIVSADAGAAIAAAANAIERVMERNILASDANKASRDEDPRLTLNRR